MNVNMPLNKETTPNQIVHCLNVVIFLSDLNILPINKPSFVEPIRIRRKVTDATKGYILRLDFYLALPQCDKKKKKQQRIVRCGTPGSSVTELTDLLPMYYWLHCTCFVALCNILLHCYVRPNVLASCRCVTQCTLSRKLRCHKRQTIFRCSEQEVLRPSDISVPLPWRGTCYIMPINKPSFIELIRIRWKVADLNSCRRGHFLRR